MRFFLSLILTLCVGAGTLGAPAAAQYGGWGRITLYAGPYFGGGQRTYTGPARSLEPTGFINVAASAIVVAGTWQVCTTPGFGGRCVTLRPGRYAQLANLGLDYRIASLRPLGYGNPGYGGGGPPPAQMGGPPPQQMSGPAANIFLYDQPGLSGRARQLHVAVGNLSSVGWGGRTWSASVVAGRWQLCTGVGYAPPCYTLVPGTYRRIYNSNGNIWSARPI